MVLILSLIVGLFFIRGPANIAGTIISVAIDAVKCVPGWALTKKRNNIYDKIFSFEPAFTNFDTTTTVNSKLCSIWTVTTRNHAAPSNVKRMHIFLSSKTMTNALLATAGSDFAVSKMGRSSNMRLSAVAPAHPHNLDAVSFFGAAKYSQSPKTTTCDINEFGHRAASSVRVSSGGMTPSTSSRRATIAWGL